MTQEQELARLLAFTVSRLGGHITISKQALDSMHPTRLAWDATSDPENITLAVLSNDLISIQVDKPAEEVVECPEDTVNTSLLKTSAGSDSVL